MGGPSPDRVCSPASPLTALTLGEMHTLGWQLRSHCGKCGAYQRVPLEVMIRVLGPDTIGWGRQPACTIVSEGVWACEGRVTYSARTTPGGSWVKLNAPSERDIVIWRTRRANRAYNAYRGRGPDGEKLGPT